MSPITDVEGAFNLRDIAWAAPDTVRPGLVLRAGNLDAVTSAGWESLRARGLRTVLDLRHDVELSQAPRVPAGIDVVRVPMGDDQTSDGRPRAPKEGEPGDFGHSTPDGLPPSAAGRRALAGYLARKTDSYVARILHEASEIGRAVTSLARPGALPAIVHCASGKDRTGVVCAVVLLVAGADEDAAVADYMATRGQMPEHRFGRHRPMLGAWGLSEDEFRPAYEAHRGAMTAALGVMLGAWGSVDRYLVEAGGVSAPDLDALRCALRHETQDASTAPPPCLGQALV